MVVGRNQNIFEEVNIAYCIKNNIKICRRISGGGTVFHDEGNLNWAIINQNNIQKVNNYTWAVKCIFEALESLKLQPYLTKRNAIEINGYKVSGQAQFTNKNSIISHGTLLVNSNLHLMQPAIESSLEKDIESKAAKSVRSMVQNVSTLLGNEKLNPNYFISYFQNKCKQANINFTHIDETLLTSDKWIYNRSPKFSVVYNSNTLLVEKGIITTVTSKNGLPILDSSFLNKSFKEFLLQ